MKKFETPNFEKTEFEAVAYVNLESNTNSKPACTHPNKRTFHFMGAAYGFICDDCGLRYNVQPWDK